MADTTIKVSTDVRDRLALLAAERNTTLRDLVEQLAAATATQAELQQRQDQAAAYVQANLRPDFGSDDIAAGHQIWDSLPTDRTSPSGQDQHVGGSGGQAA